MQPAEESPRATVLPQQLLIYHPDHTFAAYLMMRQNFIQTGEEVMTGQPIGIAGVLGVSISYFFLDNNKFDANGFLGLSIFSLYSCIPHGQGGCKTGGENSL